MATVNYFYDTRDYKVYTSEELLTVDTATKRFIKRVPSDGIIQNGKYIRLNSSERDYQRETDEIINMVNNHHDAVISKTPHKQAEGNYLDADLYVYNAVFDLTKELEDNPNFHIDDLRARAIKEIRKDLPSDNYDFLSTEDIERAFEKSKNGRPVREQYKKETIKKMIISAALTILIIASYFGISKLVTEVKDAGIVNKAATSISQLSYDENDAKYYVEAFKDSRKEVDIVAQNTKRTDNKQNFYFENADIARDILKLPAYAIDMGIYTVYREMGPNRDNPGHHNLDEVISALRRYTEDDPALHEKFANCSTFNEYLIHNGFYTVNEQNKKVADTDKWINYQREAMVNFQPKLENDAKGHVRDLFVGGNE